MACPGEKDKKLLQVLKGFDAIGFDMDHTMAKYHLKNLMLMVYKHMTDYLVDQKGHPSSLKTLDWDVEKDFMNKTLIVDIPRGNLVKLDAEGYILRASHGTKFLSDQEIETMYPQRLASFSAKVVSTHDNGDDYKIMDSYFDLPACLIFGKLVDLKTVNNENVSSVWSVTYEALRFIYREENFREHTNGYFPSMVDQTTEFIAPLSTDIKNLLKQLKIEGKTLFILTSGPADYANFLLTNQFGSSYMDYFDIAVMFAQKPSFFTSNRSHLKIANDFITEGEAVSELCPKQSYIYGNWKDLHSFLQRQSGKDDIKVAYFGDGCRSDCASLATFTPWKPWFVVEEPSVHAPRGLNLPGNEGFRVTTNHPYKSSAWETPSWGDPCVDKGKVTLWYSPIKKSSVAIMEQLDDLLFY